MWGGYIRMRPDLVTSHRDEQDIFLAETWTWIPKCEIKEEGSNSDSSTVIWTMGLDVLGLWGGSSFWLISCDVGGRNPSTLHKSYTLCFKIQHCSVLWPCVSISGWGCIPRWQTLFIGLVFMILGEAVIHVRLIGWIAYLVDSYCVHLEEGVEVDYWWVLGSAGGKK